MSTTDHNAAPLAVLRNARTRRCMMPGCLRPCLVARQEHGHRVLDACRVHERARRNREQVLAMLTEPSMP